MQYFEVAEAPLNRPFQMAQYLFIWTWLLTWKWRKSEALIKTGWNAKYSWIAKNECVITEMTLTFHVTSVSAGLEHETVNYYPAELII